MQNSNKSHFQTRKCFAELPAGSYYIGDISNFLQTDIYDNFWVKKHDKTSGHFVIDNQHFAVLYCGNGSYLGSNKHIYDGNNIGIVAADIGDKDLYTGNGTFHTFTEPVKMVENCGIVAFVSGSTYLLIDTQESLDTNEYDDGYDSWG